ncbi:hypothetical protein [Photobacterium profundum]|uniref:hypothetical protein n=1 Tax=Photobacterium TaxID=657 RepID=UPI0002F90A00|nr:hypothetical protein [Photobacterium profundum]
MTEPKPFTGPHAKRDVGSHIVEDKLIYKKDSQHRRNMSARQAIEDKRIKEEAYREIWDE